MTLTQTAHRQLRHARAAARFPSAHGWIGRELANLLNQVRRVLPARTRALVQQVTEVVAQRLVMDAEKVRRLQAVFGEEVRLRAAYGDTSGDTEMLAIAEEPGYRVFQEKP